MRQLLFSGKGVDLRTGKETWSAPTFRRSSRNTIIRWGMGMALLHNHTLLNRFKHN